MNIDTDTIEHGPGPTLSELIAEGEASRSREQQLERRLAIISGQRRDALRSWTHDTGLFFWMGLVLGAIIGLVAGIWGVQ